MSEHTPKPRPLLYKYEQAIIEYWVADTKETLSHKRLLRLDEAMRAARQAVYDQHDALTAKALLVGELVAALAKAREDICWMLNQRKFLNADCFDYLHVVLAKHTRPT